jgi:hypothetical protein
MSRHISGIWVATAPDGRLPGTLDDEEGQEERKRDMASLRRMPLPCGGHGMAHLMRPGPTTEQRQRRVRNDSCGRNPGGRRGRDLLHRDSSAPVSAQIAS